MKKKIKSFKKCSRKNCEHKGELQPVSNFHANNRNKDRLQYFCKDCASKEAKNNPKKKEYGRRYRKNNTEKYKKWRKVNQEKIKEYYKKYSLERKNLKKRILELEEEFLKFLK